MSSNLIARLNSAHGSNPDPDAIARSVGGNGWKEGKTFTDEDCAEWAHAKCKVWNEYLGIIKYASWTFWFNNKAADREWLRGACGDHWFVRIEDYFEGSLPPCQSSKS